MVCSLNGTAHVNPLQQLCIGIADAGGICHGFFDSHLGVLPLAVIHLLKDNVGPRDGLKIVLAKRVEFAIPHKGFLNVKKCSGLGSKGTQT